MSKLLDKFYSSWELSPLENTNSLCFYYKFTDNSLAETASIAAIELMNSNDFFRTVFNRQSTQYLVPTILDSDFSIINLTISIDENVQDYLRNLSTIPFNLNSELLIKVFLIHLEATNETILFFNIHHILLDGVGLTSFLNSLTQYLVTGNLPSIACSSVKPLRKVNDKTIKNYLTKIENCRESYESHTHNSQKIYSETIKLDDLVLSKINNISKKYEVSVFNLLLLSFSIFDSKLNNRAATFILYPIDLRSIDSNNTLGCEINSVTFPFSWLPSESMLDKIKQHCSEIQLYKDISNIDILDLIDNYSLPTNIPSFADSSMAMLPSLVGCTPYIFPQMSNSPYGIKYQSVEGCFYLRFDCYNDVFSDDLKSTLLIRYIKFLERLVDDIDMPLSKLDILLGQKESQQLLKDFNSTCRDYSRCKTLIDLFESTVEKSPNNVAVSSINGKLTYRELQTKSKSFAIHLHKQYGVKAGDFVAILSERDYGFHVSVLAVLYLGAAYIPLDRSNSEERINDILEDTSAYLIVDGSAYSKYSKYIKLELNVLAVDLEMLPFNIDKTMPACMIYTSGSTGKPKGAMLSHRNLVNLSEYYIQSRKLKHGENIAAHASFGFDAGAILATIAPLLAGCNINIIPEEIKLDLNLINNFIINNNVVGCFFTTLLAEQYISAFESNTLRFVECGGEKLNLYTERSYDLYNIYGPTECTVFSTQYLVKEQLENIPIGKPIANTKCYVVDKFMNLVPAGVIGELYIGGDGVGLGYYNRPELTAKTFVKNPFQTENDAEHDINDRLYKTGDLVRMLPDGNIEYIGRNDFQVKIRGYRIELGEIEFHLQSMIGINQVLVLALEDNYGSKHLCAYYTGTQYDNNQLIDFLAGKLVSYMMPDQFVWVSQFPLTINGKVDRRALPKPELNKLLAEFVAPSTEQEKCVCEAFGKVLNLQDVGINDDFFQLGGNSIKMIKLVSLLKNTFEIKVTDVHKLKTPYNLAQLRSLKLDQTVLIPRVEEREFYPVSYSQERIFIANQVAGAKTLYNIPLIIKIDGDLDRELIGIAIDHLFQRHSILRTKFITKDGEILQYVIPNINLKKEFKKITRHELSKEYEEFIEPFNLTADIPVRVKLLKIDSSEHYLLFDFHHIVFDGGSILPLLSDLSQLYQGVDLPENKINYHDYAVWQRYENGNNLVMDQEKNYWFDRFSRVDIEPLNLPLDFPRVATINNEGKFIQGCITQNYYTRLQAISKTMNVSLNSLCFTAFVILWYKYTNQKDIIVGSTINGRDRDEISDLIGMFVNTVPVLTHVDGNFTLSDLIKEKQLDWLNILSNQNYPIENLITDLQIHSESGRNPLFDVVFNFIEKLDQVGKFSVETPKNTLSEAKFDILFDVEDQHNQLDIIISYKSSLFSTQTISSVMSAYINICKAICEDSSMMVKNVEILEQKEKHQIIHEFNQTKYEYDHSRTYFDDYLDNVQNHPDKVALMFRETTITFSELNSLAINYATKLLADGVKQGDFVAILAEPSVERIAMILACHFAGVGYVPMLSEMPLDRLQFIVQDCNAKVLAVTGYELATNENLINEILNFVPTTKKFLLEYNNDLLSNSIQILNRPQPSDVAYIIYTSGTTGNPKGSPITHFSLNNYLIWHADYFKINDQDICVQFAGFSFDASVIDIYLPLKFGTGMCIVPNEIRKDLNQMTSYLNFWKCTVSFFPTKLGELMMDNMPQHFRCLVLGGEELKKTFTNNKIQLGNICAPSECTVAVVGTYIESECKNITMGHPIYNSRSYILDENLQPVPIGVAGEWYIAGYGLSKGYINRDDLTKEKFVQNPFVDYQDPEYNLYSRMYKTGDMVCWTDDGKVKYLGRKDFQVKIRGYRIEIEDIEFHLHKYPNINGVIVLALEDSTSKFLCAYYESDSELDNQKIREHLSLSIPDYMIPDYFIWQKSFPMTVNGKIDRRALPKPDLSSLVSEYIAPTNEAETMICNQFAEILEIAKVGLSDDFFKLGGNSIKSIRLVSKLQDNFKVNVADVFKYRTPKQLADNIEFVKDNLRQKLEAIKKSYVCRDELTLDTLMLDKKDKYLQSISEINFVPSRKNISSVLLTGATGYLGCNILHQLLISTTYRVCLLVRAKSNEEAFKRANNKFKFYFDIDLSIYGFRVEVLAADLESGKFGLDIDTWSSLVDDVDSVIHSAALVKHYGEYNEFYNANVQSTINLLEFSLLTKLKDFHYISTESVLRDGYDPDNKIYVFTEDSDGSNLIARSNVYVQTKYEGEVVTRQYRDKGINSNIYRIGNLSMISSNYRNQENIEDNGFFTRIKTILNLGLVADEVAVNEVSPVDYTASAIVKLFEQSNLTNQTYHVYNPNLCNLSSLLLTDNELNIHHVSISQFIDQLLEKLSFSTYRHFIEIFMLHQGWLQESDQNKQTTTVQLMQERTNTILNTLGLTWPQITLEMICDIVNKAFKERLLFLAQNQLTASLPKHVQLNIAKQVSLVHYPKDSIIQMQDSNEGEVKFIYSGIVDNYIKSPGGWASSLSVLSDGDVINLEGIVDIPNSSQFEVIFDSTTTLEITPFVLHNILQKYPEVTKQILLRLFQEKSTLQRMYAYLK